MNKARLIEKIAELVRDKKIEGISDIRDESDRRGMRLVIELKRDAISGVVLNNLFTNTPLQTTFGIVLLAIDGGQPRTLNLQELLERFVSHRREVVTRRSRFELRNAERRIHVVEGLLVAQDIIDLVITIIRRSRDPDEARWGLMHVLSPVALRARTVPRAPAPGPGRGEGPDGAAGARAPGPRSRSYAGLQHRYEDGGFSEEQAKQILDMRLQRLTGIQREELFNELIALTREIARLRDILENESSLLDVIKAELQRGPRAVRRRAPHRDHRRGRRAHQRGPDRRGGHGGHRVPRRVRQAQPAVRVPLAAARRPRQDRRRR